MGRPNKGQLPDAPGPAIILARPQLGENIGMVARAMLNCGLGDLRLVAPRDGWPNPKAERAASGADSVLAAARVFDTVAEAAADLERLLATTARDRDLVQRVLSPRRAAADLRSWAEAGQSCGVLFGAERNGLKNDELMLADALLTFPLNPAFSSLNLSQAVLLVAYEWSQAGIETPDERLVVNISKPATKTELDEFLARLEGELDAAGFFRVPEKRATMARNIRALFARAAPTAQEVSTLHGVVSELIGKRKRGKA
ncbi:MAG: RNA methyltransferase [Rhodospirillales bacterium]|nr:MAG: RNA methyltransferase [Rhodospirillales bacterium]